jgi:hypothetical protein
MFTSYLTPEEFYAAHQVQQWILPELCEQRLRNAALVVADDLRRRGVDTARLQAPVMLVGTSLYGRVTKSTDYTGDAMTAVVASSRLVIEVDSGGYASFKLEGSKDKITWRRLNSVVTGQALEIEVNEEGTYSARFFEQYPYYRIVLTTDEAITFTAYLVDASVDMLVEYRALQDGMFLVLDIDDRTQQLYDASRERYDELVNSIKAEYDTDGDGTPDTQINLQRRVALYR